MSRFLFVAPPLTGHVNPTAAVGGELLRRGHEVAWAGHPGTLDPLLPEGAQVFPIVDDALDTRLRLTRERWLTLRGAAGLQYFWQEFLIPLGHAMVPGAEAAVAEFSPDVLVADQQALAGALVARRNGVPWVTSASTSAELTRPLAAMPKVEEWVVECMTGFQRANGVADLVDLRFSDQMVLAFTTSALVGDINMFPGHYVFTGPALTSRPDTTGFPWDWLDPRRRHVLVSLGTLNGEAGPRFFRTVVEALADLGTDIQLILVAPDGVVGSPPPHVLVRSFVPQLALLPHLDAVVSHGGHNTACEALAHGLPLVVAPIRDDQPIVARQVTNAGAGIQVRFGRIRADELRSAVLAVLDEPSYRQAARRVQESFVTAGGAATAADHLEKLT